MAEAIRTEAADDAPYFGPGSKGTPYDRWVERLGIPVHQGYYLEDIRTLELGWWEDRGCYSAILDLEGQRGVTESRVSEIPPGRTTAPVKLGVDELVYVAQGRGLGTVWVEGSEPATFEWGTGALFVIPRFHTHQLTNVSGSEPVRLLHTNYLPLMMSIVPETEIYFDSPVVPAPRPPADLYSAAQMRTRAASYAAGGMTSFWYGNFFPDMRAWDQLKESSARGGGAHSVGIQFPNSPMSCHMAVFEAGLYKKAHRHGPGFVIVIPGGEGYSIMWAEGQEKVVIPWHEASVFVPPARWYHQHFNVGAAPARYLALHPPKAFSGEREGVQPGTGDQIEYTEEEPWVRERFAAELAQRGLTSHLPPDVYRDVNYRWS